MQPVKCGTLITSGIKENEPFLARTFILLFTVNLVSSMFEMTLKQEGVQLKVK